jgi:hypothetical protein
MNTVEQLTLYDVVRIAMRSLNTLHFMAEFLDGEEYIREKIPITCLHRPYGLFVNVLNGMEAD